MMRKSDDREFIRRTGTPAIFPARTRLACGLFVAVLAASPAALGQTAATDEEYAANEAALGRADTVCRQDRNSEECRDLMETASEIITRHLLLLAASADGAKYMEVVVPYARARNPRIRRAAAVAIGGLVPIAKETPALIALLNDPVPAVRSAAKAAMGASIDPVANRLAEWAARADANSFVADSPPDPEGLGAPIYDGAAYAFFASDPGDGILAYSSADPRDDVLDFYAARGVGGSLTLSEFEQSYVGLAELENNPAAAMQMQQQMIMQMMQQGGSGGGFDPMAMMTAPAAEIDLERYRDGSVYVNPRIVVLEELNLGGMKFAKRAVVIFEDRLLGGSGIVFHAPPPPPQIPGLSTLAPSSATPITPPPGEEKEAAQAQSGSPPPGMPSQEQMNQLQQQMQQQMQELQKLLQQQQGAGQQ